MQVSIWCRPKIIYHLKLERNSCIDYTEFLCCDQSCDIVYFDLLVFLEFWFALIRFSNLVLCWLYSSDFHCCLGSKLILSVSIRDFSLLIEFWSELVNKVFLFCKFNLFLNKNCWDIHCFMIKVRQRWSKSSLLRRRWLTLSAINTAWLHCVEVVVKLAALIGVQEFFMLHELWTFWNLFNCYDTLVWPKDSSWWLGFSKLGVCCYLLWKNVSL